MRVRLAIFLFLLLVSLVALGMVVAQPYREDRLPTSFAKSVRHGHLGHDTFSVYASGRVDRTEKLSGSEVGCVAVIEPSSTDQLFSLLASLPPTDDRRYDFLPTDINDLDTSRYSIQRFSLNLNDEEHRQGIRSGSTQTLLFALPADEENQPPDLALQIEEELHSVIDNLKFGRCRKIQYVY